jgi:hypothetical protein
MNTVPLASPYWPLRSTDDILILISTNTFRLNREDLRLSLFAILGNHHELNIQKSRRVTQTTKRTFFTNAFTPTLETTLANVIQILSRTQAYRSWSSFANPFSSGTGVPLGSCDASRGAMITRLYGWSFEMESDGKGGLLMKKVGRGWRMDQSKGVAPCRFSHSWLSRD